MAARYRSFMSEMDNIPEENQYESDDDEVFDHLRRNFMKEKWLSRCDLMTESMRVYLRVRPLTAKERDRDLEVCLNILDEHTVQTNPPRDSQFYKNHARANQKTSYQFSFSKIFDQSTSQGDFFHETMLDLTKDFIKGENCMVFSYGVTNSGKTYTMQGEQHEAGVLPRTLDLLFTNIGNRRNDGDTLKPTMFSDVIALSDAQCHQENQIKHGIMKMATDEGVDVTALMTEDLTCDISQTTNSTVCSETSAVTTSSNEDVNASLDVKTDNRTDLSQLTDNDSDMRYSVWVNFAEIYNEQIYDLLEDVPSKKKARRVMLKLSEDKQGCPYIKGLKDIEVSCPEEALRLMVVGQKNLRKACTFMNHSSSRSHCIFTIKLIRTKDVTDPTCARVSMMSLCDLAGSERQPRQSNSRVSGERLKEAGSINNSLQYLGRCIETLRHNQLTQGNQIIPFRNSKLTRLFQNFFIGKGKAVMIVNVNTLPISFDEMLHVLKFSTIAKQVMIETVKPDKCRSSRSSRSSAASDRSLYRGSIPWADSAVQDDESNENEEESDDETATGDESDEYDSKVLLELIEKKNEEIKELIKEKRTDEWRIRTEVCETLTATFDEIKKSYEERLEDAEEEQDRYFERKIRMLLECQPTDNVCKQQMIARKDMDPSEYDVYKDDPPPSIVLCQELEKLKQAEVENGAEVNRLREINETLERERSELEGIIAGYVENEDKVTELDLRASDAINLASMLELKLKTLNERCKDLETELREKIDTLKEAGTRKELESEKWKNEVLELKAVIEKNKKSLDELNEQLNNSETVIADLKRTNSEIIIDSNRFNEVKASVESLKVENEQLQSKVCEVKKKKVGVKGMLSKEKSNLEEKEKEFENLNKKYKDAELQKDVLHKRLREMEVAGSKTASKLEMEKTGLKAKTKETESLWESVEKLEKENGGLKDKMRKMNDSRDLKNEELKEMKSELKDKNCEVNRLMKEIEQAYDEVKKIKEEMVKIEEVTCNRGDVEDELKQSQADIKALRENADETSKCQLAKEAEIEDLKSTIESYKHDIKQLQSQMMERQIENDDLSDEVEKDQITIDDLKKQLEDNKTKQSELETSQNELATIRNELKNTQNKQKNTQSELKTIQGELKTTQNELKTTQNELETTQKELETTQNELETTQNELETTKKELETTQNELETTQKELETTQKELETTQNELETTQKELETTQIERRKNRELSEQEQNHVAELQSKLESESAKSKSNNDDLETKLKDYKNKVKDGNDEIKGLEKDVKAKERAMKILEEKEVKNKEAVDELVKEIEMLRRKLELEVQNGQKEKENYNEKMDAMKCDLESQLAIGKDEQSASDDEMEKLKEKLRDTEKKQSSLVGDNEKLVNDLSVEKDKVKESISEIENRDREVEKMKTELEEAQNKYKQLEDDLNRLRGENLSQLEMDNDVLDSLRNDLEAAKAEIKKKETQVKTHKNSYEELVSKMAQEHIQTEVLKKECNAHKANVEQLKTVTTEQEKALEEQDNMLSMNRDKINALTTDISELKQELADISGENDDTNAKKQKINDENSKLLAENTNLSQQLEKMRGENDKIIEKGDGHLQELTRRLELETEKLSKSVALKQNLELKLKEQTGEMKDIEKLLAEARRDLETATSQQSTHINTELNDLKKQVGELHAKLQAKEQMNTDLQGEIQNLSVKKEKEMKIWRDQRDKLVGGLETHMRKLNDENNQLKKELSEASNKGRSCRATHLSNDEQQELNFLRKQCETERDQKIDSHKQLDIVVKAKDQIISDLKTSNSQLQNQIGGRGSQSQSSNPSSVSESVISDISETESVSRSSRRTRKRRSTENQENRPPSESAVVQEKKTSRKRGKAAIETESEESIAAAPQTPPREELETESATGTPRVLRSTRKRGGRRDGSPQPGGSSARRRIKHKKSVRGITGIDGENLMSFP